MNQLLQVGGVSWNLVKMGHSFILGSPHLARHGSQHMFSITFLHFCPARANGSLNCQSYKFRLTSCYLRMYLPLSVSMQDEDATTRRSITVLTELFDFINTTTY